MLWGSEVDIVGQVVFLPHTTISEVDDVETKYSFFCHYNVTVDIPKWV